MNSMTSPFKRWKPTITSEEIFNYLLTWQDKGFNVVQGKPPAIDGWTIEFTASKWVSIRPHGNNPLLWNVGVSPLGRGTGPFGTLEEVDAWVNNSWRMLGVMTKSPPRQTNLFRGQPIQNTARLMTMLNNEAIEAIYDPFFDDRACLRLTMLKALGAKYNSSFKILTSEKKPSSQLTVDDLSCELGSLIEIRKTADKEHHRLIFVSTGRCLSPDLSLNRLDNSGSVVQISNPSEKSDLFFDPEWEKGTLLFQSTPPQGQKS